MTCGTCRFWESNGKEGGLGFCHRYPPQNCAAFFEVRGIDVGDDGESLVHPSESAFPSSSEDEWCGEYQHAIASSATNS